MKKHLEEYAMLAEIVSALAIVASLIFVGFEIRQSAHETALNTTAIETAAFYSLSDSVASQNLVRIEVPGFEELRMRALRGDQTLDEVEEFKYRAYLQMVLRLAETAHMQFENGIIDEASLNSLLTPFRGNFSRSPYATNTGSDARTNRRIEFVDYIENYMKNRSIDCEASFSQSICDYWMEIETIDR